MHPSVFRKKTNNKQKHPTAFKKKTNNKQMHPTAFKKKPFASRQLPGSLTLV